MSNTINGVEHKRPSDQELERALDGHGQSSGSSDERGGLEVPADKGGSEVGDGGSVEGAGEGGARDALPGGTAEPGLLGVVDLEVGGDGAAETLFGEDGGFVGRSEAFGLDGSVFFW